VGLHIGLAAQQPLLLGVEEHDPDRAPGLRPHGLEDAQGLHHRHAAGAIVRGSRGRVPRIEMGAQEHDLLGLFRAGDLRDDVVALRGRGMEAVPDFQLQLGAPTVWIASHPKAPGSAPNAPIPPRGDFFLLMRSLHALRLNEGLNTHTPGQFLHFLEATQGLAKPGETLHLVVDTWQALRDVRVEAHLEGRPELRIGQLEEDCAWKDLMRWWFQPLVAQRLAQGALPSFPDLEQALALFLRRGDPDPFQWIADRIHYL